MVTNIFVRESVDHYEPPQRATVHLDVKGSGLNREHVRAQVSDVLHQVRAQIESLHDEQEGPVTWFAVSKARTWSWKDDDGVKFSEEVCVKVKFCDFSCMGAWMNSVLAFKGARVWTIEWSVTELRKRELETWLRQKAVRSAKDKAEQYASALGLHVSSVKTVADEGFLEKNTSGGMSSVAASRGGGGAGYGKASSDAYQFTPEDVRMSASIEAEFLAE